MKPSPVRPGRVPPSGVAVFVAVTLIAPLLAGIALAVRAASESPLQSDATYSPLLAAVGSATRSHEMVVQISIVPAEALSPRANVGGLVTAVSIGPGDSVGTGKVVGSVDDGDIVAYQADAPLYADVTPGTTGRTAATAQTVLAELGFYQGPVNGVVDGASVEAIKKFNLEHGHRDRGETFPLAALTWIGPASVTVSEVTAHTGDTIAAGSELFTTTASLAGVKVSETPGVASDALGTPAILTVRGITVDYTLGSGFVADPAFAAEVAAALGTATEDTGTIALSNPVAVGTIPVTALVTDDAGRVCYFTSVDSGPSPVTPLSTGNVATADVDPDLIGTPILVNPREVRTDLSCG